MNLHEAFSKLKNCQLVAGGTDLVVLLKEKRLRPQPFFSLHNIDGLNQIVEKENSYLIGANVTIEKILSHKKLIQDIPLLKMSLETIGSTQIRNMATLAGNIITASPAGDSIPALLNLEASLTLQSVDSSRTVLVDDFFIGPRKTILKAEEILTQIEISKQKDKEFSYFKKLGQRKALSIAIASMSLRLLFDSQNKISLVKISVGSLAPTPKRLYQTEKRLLGKYISDILSDTEIFLNVSDEISPISDIRASAEYRKVMGTQLLKEAFTYLASQIESH